MWQKIQHIKQLFKNRMIYFHRDVCIVEYNAVFMIVAIWRILQFPILSINPHRNRTQILPCRMIGIPGKPCVFWAELAFRICSSLLIASGCNIPRVFLRFGTIDGNIQHAIFRGILPLFIFCDSASPYIIQLLADVKIPVRCCFWAFLIPFLKLCNHFMRHRCQDSHQLGVK